MDEKKIIAFLEDLKEKQGKHIENLNKILKMTTKLKESHDLYAATLESILKYGCINCVDSIPSVVKVRLLELRQKNGAETR